MACTPRWVPILGVCVALTAGIVGCGKASDTKTADWYYPNGDIANTRSVTDSGISSSTVKELGIAWAAEVPGRGPFGGLATNPIVVDNTVYVQDLGNNVMAYDLKDGSLKWEKRVDTANHGPNGVAVDDKRVYFSSNYQTIMAVSRESGEELWTRKIVDRTNEGIDIQPVVYDGVVYLSTVPGNNVLNFYKGKATGVIYALSAETGEIKWSFDTVDSKDIWGNIDINSGGGAWYPPLIDGKNNLIYWGTGNPGPIAGTAQFPNGSSRPGPNLYTNSIIALKLDTGELVWYDQVKPHDLFDLDFQSSPVLTRASINGVEKSIVIGSGKAGYVIAWDAATRQRIWQTAVGLHKNDDVQVIPPGETIDVLPGLFGGVLTPLAVAGERVFVPVVNRAWSYTSSSNGSARSEASGELVALDLSTGVVAWKAELPEMALGGATVVNDIVITAGNTGTIYAFDINDGAEVWTYKLPAGINASPAVAGDTIIFPAGINLSEESVPQVVALRLGAKGKPVVAPTPSP